MESRSHDMFLKVAAPLRIYHRHETYGIENIPDDGPCILSVNHSLATYDIGLLMAAIYQHTGRYPTPLMDRWFFRNPQIAGLCKALGFREGRQESAEEVLDDNGIVLVAPGGMHESLRPSSERYQVDWDKRRGFAKLALQEQVPIILAACPRADDLFTVHKTPLTDMFYKRFKFPLVFARGWGPTPLPRPVVLEHFISKPIVPPPLADTAAKQKAQLYRFHRRIIKQMETLMGHAVCHRRSSSGQNLLS